MPCNVWPSILAASDFEPDFKGTQNLTLTNRLAGANLAWAERSVDDVKEWLEQVNEGIEQTQ